MMMLACKYCMKLGLHQYQWFSINALAVLCIQQLWIIYFFNEVSFLQPSGNQVVFDFIKVHGLSTKLLGMTTLLWSVWVKDRCKACKSSHIFVKRMSTPVIHIRKLWMVRDTWYYNVNGNAVTNCTIDPLTCPHIMDHSYWWYYLVWYKSLLCLVHDTLLFGEHWYLNTKWYLFIIYNDTSTSRLLLLERTPFFHTCLENYQNIPIFFMLCGIILSFKNYCATPFLPHSSRQLYVCA